MAQIILRPSVDNDQKVLWMQRDALYDVDSSDDALSAIAQNIRSKAALPKVPKVFFANDCTFNCAYCGCRASHDCARYENTPRELAELSVKQALKQKHGIFISSAIVKSADYTQERIVEALRIIREDLHYGGYVHAKVMPGADRGLIERAGLYANRLSVNIEVARSEGYRMVAKNKNKGNILTPMGQISDLIATSKGMGGRRFATSQTTQLMAGSTGEDDRTILTLSGALYKKYRLSRVYYTAFHYRGNAQGYSELAPANVPHWRMHRLYQADRLMQLYGYSADDIAPHDNSFLDANLDPKAAYALRNLHLFPVEVNTADYEQLLRVPGIGIIYAQRILAARKVAALSHDSLRTLGVPLKRCAHFITCAGRFQGISITNERLFYACMATPPKQPAAHQLSLFEEESFCQ